MAGTAWMWSQCPWVSRTRLTFRRWARSSSFSCSLAASMRTASPVSLQRRTNTLFSYGPTTSLWISSRLSEWCRVTRSSGVRAVRSGAVGHRCGLGRRPDVAEPRYALADEIEFERSRAGGQGGQRERDHDRLPGVDPTRRRGEWHPERIEIEQGAVGAEGVRPEVDRADVAAARPPGRGAGVGDRGPAGGRADLHAQARRQAIAPTAVDGLGARFAEHQQPVIDV